MKCMRMFLVGAAALTLWGCGGGGGTGGPTPSDPLAGGRAALNQMASGQQPTSQQTLQSALDLFQQAIQQNPNSPEANFGAAICMAGVVSQEVDGGTATIVPTVPPTVTGSGGAAGSNGGSRSAHSRDVQPPPPPNSGGPALPPSPTSGDLPPAPPGHTDPVHPIPPSHTLGLIWNLDRGLSSPYTLLNMLAPLADLHLGLIAYYGYPADSQDVTRRQQMLTDLNTVEQRLQTVEADPNFSFTLPAPDQNGQPVTIGLPEVYLFDAFINSLRTQIALSLAYNRDPGNFDLFPPAPPVVGGGGGTGVAPPPPPVFSGGGSGSAGSGTASGGSTGSGDASHGPIIVPSTLAILDKNHDGKLTPDEYLPPSPFLTLRDATMLQTAQQGMLAIVDKEGKGIAGVLARPANGQFLIPNTPDVSAALTEIRDHVLPLIKQAATGPVTIEIPHYQPVPLVAELGTSNKPTSVAGQALFALQPIGGLPPAPPVITPTEPLTIDLAAWFTNPPADLKKFAPTYTLDSIGFIDYSKTTYPDPTFGGLFPKGLPPDLQL